MKYVEYNEYIGPNSATSAAPTPIDVTDHNS